MAVSEDSVEAELRVGMLDMALAKLLSSQHHTIEFPTLLLPENVEPGSIVRLTCTRAAEAELQDAAQFEKVQQQILEKFASTLPKTPVLRARNVTQTSVVLEWDPIDIASADLRYLALYKGAQRLGLIPNALKRTSMKVSNLEIDMPYTFRLVLSSSAGDFESEPLDLQTHKMSDLSGVVVCVGSLNHSRISAADIEDTLQRLGCKPAQSDIKLDTTHFLCTTEGGSQYDRAVELSIPIVRPEWLKACEAERKLVSVRGYYLSADPQKVPPIRERTMASPPVSTAEQHASSSQPEAPGSSTGSQEASELPDSQGSGAHVEREGSTEPRPSNKNQHVRFDVPGDEQGSAANGEAHKSSESGLNESGDTLETHGAPAEQEDEAQSATREEPVYAAADASHELASEAAAGEHGLETGPVPEAIEHVAEPPVESAEEPLELATGGETTKEAEPEEVDTAPAQVLGSAIEPDTELDTEPSPWAQSAAENGLEVEPKTAESDTTGTVEFTNKNEHVTGEPSVEHDPAAGNEPSTENELTVENEPAAENEPSTENEPTIENEPAAKNEPTTENEPTIENEPTTENEPTIENEPAAENEPASENLLGPEEERADPEPAVSEPNNNEATAAENESASAKTQSSNSAAPDSSEEPTTGSFAEPEARPVDGSEARPSEEQDSVSNANTDAKPHGAETENVASDGKDGKYASVSPEPSSKTSGASTKSKKNKKKKSRN